MRVKELIEELQKYDGEKEVIIRFGLDDRDDVGYILETFATGEYGKTISIYAEYTTTKEDCDFIGQIDLKEAYKKMLEE